MKQNYKWMIFITGILALLLAACSGNTPVTGTNQTEGQEAAGQGEEAAVPEQTEPTDDEGEIITLYVGPELAECTGAGLQMCMLVKENPDDEYQYFYNQIEGFTYEPGYEYELEVLVTPVENPPADGSSLNYSLVEEVSKTAVDTTGTETAVDTAESDPLNGTSWVLQSMQGNALVENSETTIAFQDGGVNGVAGCNNYFGSYQIDGNHIDMGPIGSTEMFCEPEALMAQETAYLGTLRLATQFQIEDDQLILMDEEETILLTYTDSEPISLTGTLWQAIGYNNGKRGVISLVEGTEITAVFSKDGRLSGSSGCNNYTSSYTVEGENLTISEQMTVTRRACPPEIGEQENAYLAALLQAATYRIEGDRLQIRDAGGSLLADYIAAPLVSLTSGTWVVTTYNVGNDAVSSVINGMRLTAVFGEDDSLSGFGGCNSYNGSYTTDGNNIAIGPLATTLMACAQNVMQMETAYLTALQSAVTYQISGDTLQLHDDNGALAVSYTLETPAKLAGSTWDVISYNNGNQAVVSVIIGTELTAVFGEDGTLTGSAGCNNYTSNYEADDENISIGPAASTRMFCETPEGIMEQESQYLAALQTAVTYKIDGERMEMRTVEGSLVANFQEAGYVDPEIRTFLENATYQMEMSAAGEVTLENGEYSETIVEGSASKLNIILTDHAAVGTLNDQFAAVAVVVADSGGSGTFYYLAVFTLGDEGLENTATILLGDRVQTNSVDITQNTIVVDMIQAGPDDPMCCPTQHVVNVYELQGDELILHSSTPVEE
ncbi:MAG: META domain-containing protein [Chloroflexi bacterium]|nr:META domain-containing protein [Chloroflexota bacterium]